MADTNCAAKLMAALLSDGKGQIINEADIDPNDNINAYICIDLGDSGVICIKRPKQGNAVRVTL